MLSKPAKSFALISVREFMKEETIVKRTSGLYQAFFDH